VTPPTDDGRLTPEEVLAELASVGVEIAAPEDYDEDEPWTLRGVRRPLGEDRRP
jgi:hypothetical protein